MVNYACASRPTNFWFDHSAVCNKLCVVKGNLNSLRAESVGKVIAY